MMFKIGSSGDAVKSAQKMLNLLGEKLTADGKFDKRTADAMQRFQQVEKLPITGSIDRQNLERLAARTSKIKPPQPVQSQPQFQDKKRRNDQ